MPACRQIFPSLEVNRPCLRGAGPSQFDPEETFSHIDGDDHRKAAGSDHSSGDPALWRASANPPALWAWSAALMDRAGRAARGRLEPSVRVGDRTRDIRRQHQSCADQRVCRHGNSFSIAGAAAIAFLERRSRIVVGYPLRLGYREGDVAPCQIAQIAFAEIRSAVVPAHVGAERRPQDVRASQTAPSTAKPPIRSPAKEAALLMISPYQ